MILINIKFKKVMNRSMDCDCAFFDVRCKKKKPTKNQHNIILLVILR